MDKLEQIEIKKQIIIAMLASNNVSWDNNVDFIDLYKKIIAEIFD